MAATKIRVRFCYSSRQATRTEPARSVECWLVFTPVGPVQCQTREEMLELCASFNAEPVQEIV